MGRSVLFGISMVALSVFMRLVYDLYYRRHAARILRLLRLSGGEKPAGHISYYTRFDRFFCVLPFAWCWLDIYSATLLAVFANHVAAYILLIVFVGGRFRALQEIGHNAVHGALARSRNWQWFLSDVFFQFPTFKRDMHARFVTHVKEHHRNPNQPVKDPNLMRIIAGGMVPNISKRRFYFNLFYPLLPAGFWVGLRTMAQHSTLFNRNFATLVLRVVTVAAVICGFIGLAGWRGLLLGYVIPLFITYPLYTWLSLLSEHRWFVASDAEAARRTMECTNCRPLDFPGIHGWVIRQLVYPLSDQYHLAHSLYPFVRWNYLPAIDRALKERDELYARYRSEGFLFGRKEMPAALSELRDRLTGARDWDLAPWSAQYARQAEPSTTSFAR